MRCKTRIALGLAGLFLAAAPAAQASDSFGVAKGSQGCTTPTATTGNGAAIPNQPCWVAGVYKGDYTGMGDTPANPPNNHNSYFTTAGGHPFTGVTDFEMATTTTTNMLSQTVYEPVGTLSKLRVDVPPGIVSDPQAVPQCPQPTGSASAPVACPPGDQLGVVLLEVLQPSPGPADVYLGESVYNMDPGGTSGPCHAEGLAYASDFAFNTPTGAVHICGGARSGSEDLVPHTAADDGQYFAIDVPSSPLGSTPLIRSTLIFWGDPGDSAHSSQQSFACGPQPTPCGPSQCQFNSSVKDTTDPGCNGTTPPADWLQPSGGRGPVGTPFISLPSACLPAGQVTTLTLDRSDSATPKESQGTSTTPVAATDCTNVPFNPTLSITTDSTRSDAPSGATIDVHVPQPDYQTHATAPATSLLQDSAVTLPPGMTLDPSAANGLEACTPAQFNQGSDAAPKCPSKSQIGTVTIDSPLLASTNQLTGAAYLGCDKANPKTPCPATKGLSYLYVYVQTPDKAVTLKLAGLVTANPATGQVTTTFTKLPQEPFTDFILKLNGGPTAPLANPLACGTATMTSVLTPYSGNAAAQPTASFKIDKGADGGKCMTPTPFAPTLKWSAQTLKAGAFDRKLTITFTRKTGQQYLGVVAVQMPPGLVGLIPSVPLCKEPHASRGTCPKASRIGKTTVLAGSGSKPITQSGKVYLTGPYAGAPFGLSIVVPAIAGPFNFGKVVVRAAINVDKTDAHLTIVSSLPQVVGGVPLRIRKVSVTINHPKFLLNPTSCQPLALSAILSSTGGAGVAPSDPFQPFGCAALPFQPSLKLALTGKGQTTNGKHPSLVATFASSLGEANVRSSTVTLPLSLALDPRNAQHVCSVAASDRDACPAKTIIGHATVKTPLLNTPLQGTVYLVQGIRIGPQGQMIRTLPTLLIPLRGQVAIDLRAQTSVDSKGRLVTTFPATPDASFSRFVLKITGGPHGLLVVTGHANVCHGPQLAPVTLVAQSGATSNRTVHMATPVCGTSAAHHSHHH